MNINRDKSVQILLAKASEIESKLKKKDSAKWREIDFLAADVALLATLLANEILQSKRR